MLLLSVQFWTALEAWNPDLWWLCPDTWSCQPCPIFHRWFWCQCWYPLHYWSSVWSSLHWFPCQRMQRSLLGNPPGRLVPPLFLPGHQCQQQNISWLLFCLRCWLFVGDLLVTGSMVWGHSPFCQIILQILCKAIIMHLLLPVPALLRYCLSLEIFPSREISQLLQPLPTRLGSCQYWQLVGHSAPQGHLWLCGCTVPHSILSTFLEFRISLFLVRQFPSLSCTVFSLLCAS